MNNQNIALARQGIMELMKSGRHMAREDMLDLLSAATIHPEEFGEVGPRMGLDPKIANPYRSTEATVRLALDELQAEHIISSDVQHGKTDYSRGPNFEAGQVECAKATATNGYGTKSGNETRMK